MGVGRHRFHRTRRGPPGYDGATAVRAVRVDAPPDVVFRWLTQLAVAPYSYDWIDNRGRRSPRHLVEGIELEPGRPMMEIFRLAGTEPGHRLDLEMADPRAVRWFGQIMAVYRAVPDGDGTVLRCDLFLADNRGPARLRDWLLSWGDLVMMRKQLLTLGRLAERTALGFTPRPRDA